MDTTTRINILKDHGLPMEMIAAILGAEHADITTFTKTPASVPAVSGGGGGYTLLAESFVAAEEAITNVGYPACALMPTPDTITFTLTAAALVALNLKYPATAGAGGNNNNLEIRKNGEAVPYKNAKGKDLKIAFTNGLYTFIGFGPDSADLSDNLMNFNCDLTAAHADEGMVGFLLMRLAAGTHTFDVRCVSNFVQAKAKNRRLSAYKVA